MAVIMPPIAIAAALTSVRRSDRGPEFSLESIKQVGFLCFLNYEYVTGSAVIQSRGDDFYWPPTRIGTLDTSFRSCSDPAAGSLSIPSIESVNESAAPALTEYPRS